MSQLTLKEAVEIVVKAVTNAQGCKATELICTTEIEECHKNGKSFEWLTAVEEAIRQKKIIEIEYVLASMPHRIKSFLLPPKTEVHIRDV